MRHGGVGGPIERLRCTRRTTWKLNFGGCLAHAAWSRGKALAAALLAGDGRRHASLQCELAVWDETLTWTSPETRVYFVDHTRHPLSLFCINGARICTICFVCPGAWSRINIRLPPNPASRAVLYLLRQAERAVPSKSRISAARQDARRAPSQSALRLHCQLRTSRHLEVYGSASGASTLPRSSEEARLAAFTLQAIRKAPVKRLPPK